MVRAPLLIELTGEERKILRDIRQRKEQLVNEIQQLTSEIKNITTTSASNQAKNATVNRFFPHVPLSDSLQPDLTQTALSRLELNLINKTWTSNTQPDVITSGIASSVTATNTLYQRQLAAVSQLLLQYQNDSVPTTQDLTRLIRQPPIVHWSDRPNKPVASIKPMQIDSKNDSIDSSSKLKETCVLTLDQACETFNQTQSEATVADLQSLIDSSSPIHFARFLLTDVRLSKQAIGRFLGQPHDFNQQVLQQFVKLHDLRGIAPEDALRRFLTSFHLPGEAQQIQRFLEPFASHFCNSNPGIFDHEDQLFLLSYSLLMLNTLRNRPNARAKLSKRRFLAMNRGVSRSILCRAYSSICRNPFQVPVDDRPMLVSTNSTVTNRSSFALNSSANIQGWLWKRSGQAFRLTARWCPRWFVLNGRCLFYFLKPTDTEPKGNLSFSFSFFCFFS